MSKNFLTFNENISARMSNLHSTCPKEHFGETWIFWWYWYFVQHFRSMRKKIIDFWREICGTVVKSAFYLSKGTISANLELQKSSILDHFRTLKKTIWIFGGKFVAKFSNCILRVKKNFSRNKNNLGVICLSFRNYEQTFFDFWREYFGTVVKTAL